MLQAGTADVVGFEPNPAALTRLNDMKGPHELYLPHAVADGGRHLLRICQAPGMTSLLQPNPAVLDLFHGFPDWGRVLSTEEVETVRLDDVLGNRWLRNDKDRYPGRRVDGVAECPGSAARRAGRPDGRSSSCRCMSGSRCSPRWNSSCGSRASCSTASSAEQPRDPPLLSDNNIFAGMSQMLWADAVFVRDFTRLDMLSDRQILAMGAILHDCYHSIDLVLHLLAEHDRRTAARWAAPISPACSRAPPPRP